MKRLAGAGDSQRQVTRNARPLGELGEDRLQHAAWVGWLRDLWPAASRPERPTRAPRRGGRDVSRVAGVDATTWAGWGGGVRAKSALPRPSTAACATSGGNGDPSAAAAKLAVCKRIGPRCSASWASSLSWMIIAAVRRLRRACARSLRRRTPASATPSARRSLISPRHVCDGPKRYRHRGSPTCACGLRGSERGSPRRRRRDERTANLCFPVCSVRGTVHRVLVVMRISAQLPHLLHPGAAVPWGIAAVVLGVVGGWLWVRSRAGWSLKARCCGGSSEG